MPRMVDLQKHPLVNICSTTKFFVWSPLTLRSAGIRVLNTPSVHEKANMTYQFVKAWQQGVITLVDDVSGDPEDICRDILPVKPIRPLSDDKSQWSNKKTNILSTIHGIAHAESYAIELFWDVIARFTHYNLPLEFYNEMVVIAGQYTLIYV